MALEENEHGQPKLREIADTRTMRAMAHPVRVALMEQLALAGPLTATEVGERIGESPTTCSFHLRQLAKYGLVEEAGGGRGRARPWRMSTIGMSINGSRGDTETQIAAAALGRMVRDRTLQRFQTWQDTKRTYPQEWQDAAEDASFLFFVTPDELDRLNQEVMDILLARYWDRIGDPSLRPPGSAPVEAMFLTYPVTAPPDTSGEK